MRYLKLYPLIAIFCYNFTSCTINIIQTSTHAPASDVVDSDPSTEATTDADLKLPFG